MRLASRARLSTPPGSETAASDRAGQLARR